jgi:hypothetical protein
LRAERLRERRGTFPPFSRASLSPMAIACLRLLTFLPDPLFKVPFFLRCIADFTRFEAALPYFAMDVLLGLSHAKDMQVTMAVKSRG